MFSVSGNFIGSFKTGDNIHFNLEILSLLYEYHGAADASQQRLLRKPITITLVAITEAMLRDLFERAKFFTREGVVGMDESILGDIRAKKKIDKLDHYIASARKHCLFGDDKQLYDQLDELRKLRNKVHIGGGGDHLEADESRAFSPARVVKAEEMLEYVCKSLSLNYPRHLGRTYVADFEFPWDAHYEPESKWA